jgi:hypothetical protein
MRHVRWHVRVCRVVVGALGVVPIIPSLVAGQEPGRRPQIDRTKPAPTKAEIIQAWQRRQDAIKTFQFSWTETQTHPRGWLPNPRYAQRERSAIPGLLIDRRYTVSKMLTVDGSMMRYGFEIDRAEEPDGVRVRSPRGETQGLGVRRQYSYLSVFDGRRSETRLTSLLASPPPSVQHVPANVDAQNLDTRVILLAFRPLDPVMGHLLLDRAVTNEARTFYRGRSIFLLEERHDPSGWKTVLWIEPERDFTIARFIVLFEQKWIVDIDIDYTQDERWGWIPSAWRVTQMLADGSKRLVSTAAVTRYSVNAAIPAERFR